MKQITYRQFTRSDSIEGIIFCSICAIGLILLPAFGKRLYDYVWLSFCLLFGIAYIFLAFTYRTNLIIDSSGLHAIAPGKRQLALVSWSQIRVCKYYTNADHDDIVVLFQNLDYPAYRGGLLLSQDYLDYHKVDVKVLCDSALRKLSYGRITPEEI